MDLTTHSPQRLAAFFQDKHSENLFNVAISRAKDRLFVLGSRTMLRELSKTMPFWGRVVNELAQGIECLSCDEVIDALERFDDLSSIPFAEAKQLPAIYSHQPRIGAARPGIETLNRIVASRKLLVLGAEPEVTPSGAVIVRGKDQNGRWPREENCPVMFMGGGRVCLPYGGKWLAVESPNVSRVLWRIGFSYLAEEEVDPAQARRFFCPECTNGDLLLKQFRGEGWFLVCTNGQHHTCPFRKRLSVEEAKIKVRLGNMTCPKKHPLTVRQSGTRFFLGCENYPACDYSESLSILEGT